MSSFPLSSPHVMIEEDITQEAGQKRRRVTRACDPCRKARSKCDLPADGSPCTPCKVEGISCVVQQTTRKRGPPKGYAQSLELQVRELESLLLAVLSSTNPHVKDFVRELGRHPMFKGVIEGVETRRDRFAEGRECLRDQFTAATTGAPTASTSQSHGESSRGYLHSFDISQTQSGGSTAEGQFNVTGGDMEEVEYDSDSPTGAFVLDKFSQLHFSGQSSGLPFLSKSARTDRSRQDGIWNIDVPPANNPSTPTDRVMLPSQEIQDTLLDHYFKYTHGFFPIVAKAQFYGRFRAAGVPEHFSTPFDLLLLAMFSLSSQVDGSGTEVSTQYFRLAKSALDKLYHISHPSTASALLLLALWEFGMANTTAAWLYAGLAMRMAQDLGLHTSNDVAQGGSRAVLFNDDQRTTRKRIWYGCVKLDRYLGMYAGRPLAIQDFEWSTELPDIFPDNDEESALWVSPAGQPPVQYQPVPGRTVLLFNANVHLAILSGRILHSFYTTQARKATPDPAIASKLREQMEGWYNNLPESLKIHSNDDAMKATPSLLTLHTEYWCIMILLYRPMIQREKVLGPAQQSPAALGAWNMCLVAAQHINDLAYAFGRNFSFAQVSAMLVYNLYHSGLIWVAALTFRPAEPHYFLNLEQCLRALDEIKGTHRSAALCHTLLDGTSVSPRDLPLMEQWPDFTTHDLSQPEYLTNLVHE